jgi:hypothetical protein
MNDAREADIPESSVDRRAALQMLAALGGLFVALPGQTAPPGSPTQLWTDIDQVLNKTQAIWNSQDFSRL